MVYVESTSEYKIVMFWKLILGGFGPNIKRIAGVDNTVADTLNIITHTTN